MKFVFFAFLIFMKLLYAGPEEGKAALEAFLQDPTVKNLTAPNYQTGAN